MSGQTLQKAFIPLPGRATAVYTSSGLSYYRHPDWLGSARFGSTPSRTMYSDVAYAPFGEPYAQADATDLSFTGINQDTDSDSFDFPARQYSTQGRWASPDPAGLAAVDPSFPQSWNRYAYVLNNPLRYIDPKGLTCYALDEEGNITTTEVAEIDSASDCSDAGDFGGFWIEVDTTVTVNGDDTGDVSSWTYVDWGSDWGYLPSGDFSWTSAGGSNGSAGNSNNHSPTTAVTLNVIIPLWWGLGPAGTASYVASQNLLCLGGGLGASAGHNVSAGAVAINGSPRDVLRSFSLSGGYNYTVLRGMQGSWNSSGTTVGYAMGIPGASGAITYSGCIQF